MIGDRGGETMKIGLTYDLRDDYLAEGFSEEAVAELDSEETISFLEQAIGRLGYKTERIGNGRALAARLVAGERWELVFNIAEGLSGRCRESQVPSILELYGIGYTFSDPLVCALTLDKSFAKRVVRDSGLPTAKFAVIEKAEDLHGGVSLAYPLFAKPIAEGTGKGIDHKSRVETYEQLVEVCEDLLKRFSQPVLVEEFLPGREFTVGVLGNGEDAYVPGVMEITIPRDTKAIYSFAVKEEWEKHVKYEPCREGAIFEELVDLALRSYKALQCRDAARVDFRCDGDGVPCFMEINPLPGLHPTHSDLPMIATQEGMRYEELIGQIINNALKRLKLKNKAAYGEQCSDYPQ